MNVNSEVLGTESVMKLMLKFGSFAIITMLATGAVSTVGTLILSHGVDIYAVGAIGLLFPLTTIFFGFSQLVAIGSASYISRKLGGDEPEVVFPAIIISFLLTLFISGVLMVLTFVFKGAVLDFLGAAEKSAELAGSYLSIFIFSIPFTAMTLLSSAVFRAYGKLKLSMLVILVQSFLIISLDFLFIFILRRGVGGVALSQIISGAASSLLGIILILKLNGGRSKIKKNLRWDFCVVGELVRIGVSALARSTAGAVFAIVLNRTVLGLGGEDPIAALGAVNKIILFLIYAVMGINQAMQPIVSYNYTAGNNDRVKEALKLGLIYSTTIGLVGSVIGIFFAGPVVRLFTSNTDVLDDASLIFRFRLFFFATSGIQ